MVKIPFPRELRGISRGKPNLVIIRRRSEYAGVYIYLSLRFEGYRATCEVNSYVGYLTRNVEF